MIRIQQRFADQAKLILKNGWLSEFEILEMCGQGSREEYSKVKALYASKHKILKIKTPHYLTPQHCFSVKKAEKM